MTDKELPDCAKCGRSYINTLDQLDCMVRFYNESTCVNGNKWKPSEPIRLYTITSEDKT
jgi:hypothetical protein